MRANFGKRLKIVNVGKYDQEFITIMYSWYDVCT